MTIPILDDTKAFENLTAQKNRFFSDYYAFYSSWLGGISKNPHLMLLPLDDHMVHRGDGIFEAVKAVSRSVYLFDEHLQRLFRSADKIALKSRFTLDEVKEITLETLRAANQPDVVIRIFLSRGPGSFSVDPYDPIGSQLYIAITQLRPPTAEQYAKGVITGKSHIPAKPAWLAQIKSCNYLPNVLMKKEAVDRKLDFVIAMDEQGHLTESATENIMIVDQQGTLAYPALDQILQGTMMIRACELARANGMIAVARDISIADLQAAREVMVTGTSLNILPVVEFEGQKIADGKPGPIAKKLQALMLNDIKTGSRSILF